MYWSPLLGRSFHKARKFTASSHQNAGFSIWVFKNIPGVTPLTSARQLSTISWPHQRSSNAFYRSSQMAEWLFQWAKYFVSETEIISELTVNWRWIDDCRLRQIKIDQRKLNDSANTLVDMAKVWLWDSILLRLIANPFIFFPLGSKLAMSRANSRSRIICDFWC